MTKYTINDIDATQEEYFVWHYLLELKEEGFIEKIIFQPKSFTLFEGLPKKFYEDKQLKTKVKRIYSKRKYLLNPHIYTADFEIRWRRDDSGLDLLYDGIYRKEIDNNLPFISNIQGESLTKDLSWTVSYIEVKPAYDQNGKTQMFRSYVQPQIWEKYNIYVQIIKPLDLFKQTFIPKKLWDEMHYKKSGRWGKKGDKKYKWDYKTLKGYLNEYS